MNIKSLVRAAALFAFASVAQAGPVSPCYWSGAFVKCLPSSSVLVSKYNLYESAGASGDIMTLVAPALAADVTITFPSTTSSLATNPATTTGDIIYASTTATPATLARLAIGAATTVLHGGTTPSYSAVSLTADVTGQLPLSGGGTNANLTASQGAVPYSTATAFALNTAGSTSQWLLAGGTGAPTFSDTTTRDKEIRRDSASGAVTAFNMTSNSADGTPLLRLTGQAGGGTYAAPAALGSGKELFDLIMNGNYSTTTNQYATGARIAGVTTAAWSGTSNHAAKLEFYTAKDGDANETLRQTIQPTGGVVISETSGNAGTAANNGNVPHACTKQSASAAAASVTVTCSGAGEIVMGGGCASGNGSTILNQSTPLTAASNSTNFTAWQCIWTTAVGTNTAFAICCVY